MVSFPLRDFSPPAVDAFRARSGGVEHPRTWGWADIYGPEAYGWWLYLQHVQQLGEELAGRGW